jgi:hypothetical protein
MKSSKKILSLVLLLAILGGLTFVLSRRDSLLGAFTLPSTDPHGGLGSISAIQITTTIEAAATKATEEAAKAQTAASAAAADAVDAETAYNASDRSDLETAQRAAENDGDDAKTAADHAKDYMDQAQEFYDDDYAAWESSYNDTLDAESASELAHDFWQAMYYTASKAHGEWYYGMAQAYIQQKAYECAAAAGGDSSYDSSSCTTAKANRTDISENLKDTFDACLLSDEYNQNEEKHSTTCVTAYSTALSDEWSDWKTATIKDSIRETYDLDALEADYNTKNSQTATLEDTYNTALENYATLYYTTADLRDVLDESETYLQTAIDAADQAASYASQGLSSKNLANSYQLLSCTGLSIDPTSYEMSYSDTSAAFDLTTHFTTETPASAWLTPRAWMTFTLTEIETVVQITGTINAYPVETYETQSKWAGTLVYRTSGSGIFTQGSSHGNPLEIAKTDTSDTTVSFAGGVAGNVISVAMKDEQDICSQNFTITQAGAPAVTITESTGTSVTEGGATDTYTVVLNTAPSAVVTVTATPDAQVTVSPSILSFTNSNWSTPQTVTITAVDDSVTEGTHTGTIAHSTTSADSTYNALTVTPVTATITDNDTATAGVTLTESGGNTTVSEGGATDSYTAVLNSAPSSSVIITVTPDSQVTVSPSSLTFTTSNWDTAQTITVTAANDSLTESSQTGVIKHTASSSDAAYNGLTIANITAQISDPVATTSGSSSSSSSSTTAAQASVALNDDDYDCSDPFVDTHGEWHQDIVCRLYNFGTVKGRLADEFVPNGYVTNAEFVKMVDGLLLDKTEDDAYGLTSSYKDSDSCSGKWCEPWMAIAEKEDVIRTRDFGDYFYPDTPITRGVAAVYVARALGIRNTDYDQLYSDVPITHFAAYAIASLSEEKVDVTYDDDEEEVPVLTGYDDGTFRPDNPIARSEAAALIYRAYLAYLAD